MLQGSKTQNFFLALNIPFNIFRYIAQLMGFEYLCWTLLLTGVCVDILLRLI
jgi:hypothetical protein